MKNYRVGFGRVDITPLEPVPLAGFGDTLNRISKVVRDPLRATCVAVTDWEGTTVLLYTLDLLSVGGDRERVARLKTYINAATGVPAERIMLCCTHTHSGPDTFYSGIPSLDRYWDLLVTEFTRAGKVAMEDRTPAKLMMGQTVTEGLNFVKHYVSRDKVTGEMGYLGDNFGEGPTKEPVAHTTDVDRTLHLLRFCREGKQDIIMANFRAHPILTGGMNRYDISADYPGEFCKYLEEFTGCLVGFWQGAAGNNNPFSRLKGEHLTCDCLTHGRELARSALEGLADMQEVAPEPIRTKQMMLVGKSNIPTPEETEKLRKIIAFWNETGDRAATHAMSMAEGFSSIHHVWAAENRIGIPETDTIELNVILMGPVGFTAAPNEIFDTLITDLEKVAPCEKIFMLGYTNGYEGYIPSEFGFKHGCYEADCAWYAPGIGEQIRDAFAQMITELRTEQK